MRATSRRRVLAPMASSLDDQGNLRSLNNGQVPLMLKGMCAPSDRFHLIIPGNQKTEFRNPRLNSRPLLPFNQPGFDRI